MERRLLTAKETAEYVRLNERTVRNMIGRGELRASLVGGRWLVRQSDIEDWLDRHSNDPLLAQTAGLSSAVRASRFNHPEAAKNHHRLR